MNFINNWLREITLAAAVTECPLDLPDGTYRLVLADGVGAAATRIEVIEADVHEGIAELQRGLEGTDDQEWPAGTVIHSTLTAGVLLAILDRISALESGGGAGGDALTKANFAELVPQGYYGSGASVDSGPLQLFNRRDIGCIFYGGLSGYVGIAPVYRVGIGPDIAWTDFDQWSLGVANCQHVFTVVNAGVSPYIGIAPPAGVFGAMTLSAPAFGPMYSEPPARDFQFSLELQVPPLSSGDVVSVSIRIPGFSSLALEMDPVTREWSCAGITIGTQNEFLSELLVAAGEHGSGGYPETANVTLGYESVSVPLTLDVYSQSSSLELTVRAAVSSVFRLGRIGARVTYPDYE